MNIDIYTCVYVYMYLTAIKHIINVGEIHEKEKKIPHKLLCIYFSQKALYYYKIGTESKFGLQFTTSYVYAYLCVYK